MVVGGCAVEGGATAAADGYSFLFLNFRFCSLDVSTVGIWLMSIL